MSRKINRNITGTQYENIFMKETLQLIVNYERKQVELEIKNKELSDLILKMRACGNCKNNTKCNLDWDCCSTIGGYKNWEYNGKDRNI